MGSGGVGSVRSEDAVGETVLEDDAQEKEVWGSRSGLSGKAPPGK